MKPNLIAQGIGYLQNSLQKESAYLLPLRIFIGIGWIRASLEKIIEVGWYDGSALSDFLQAHLESGAMVFPFYRSLVENIFLPNAFAMSWIIMIGQFLVGVAMLVGFFTNFALLWGLFMNLNFILAGEVNPSAFYVVIQLVLFVGNVGAILGLDSHLSRFVPISLLVAQPGPGRKYWRVEKIGYILMGSLSIVIGLVSIPYINDFGPHSVDDPAMLLMVLSVFSGVSILIVLFQNREKALATSQRDQLKIKKKHPISI